MFGNIGVFEILLICFVGLLIFGKRLPEVGRNLGRGIVEFKKGLAGIGEEVEKPVVEPPNKQLESAYRESENSELARAQQRIRELEEQLQQIKSGQGSAGGSS